MQATAKRLFPSRQVAAWTDVGLLAAVGLVASWVATIVMTAQSSNLIIDLQAPRPPLFYYTHGVALLAVMAAGLLAALRGRFRVLGFGGRIAFLVLVVSAAWWAAASYTVEELFSRAIFGATGPFVWFTLVFSLVGTDRRVWTVIDPVIRLLAYATSALALWTLVSYKEPVYHSFYLSKYTQFSVLLMWLGGWTLLSATRLRGWRLAVRTVPFFALLLTDIYSQARSWTALTVLLGVVFVILRAREQSSATAGARVVVVAGVLIAAVGIITYDSVVRKGLEGLTGRLHDDTRTGQYVYFFSAVPVSDLLLGRGPKGTWFWPGIGDYQFFDNGFLWMAFIGGLPTALSYVAIIMWPAVRMIRKNPRGQDAAAVCLVLLWGLVLTGLGTYAAPSLTLSSYLVSLLAGRCYLCLAERPNIQGSYSGRAIPLRSRLPYLQRVRATCQHMLSAKP